ncbi:hypothetical protein [Nitrosospira sp. Nsp11]|uniref:hypothetical protein n=1 Tax=Nitrosospira sp. Nsp11 TaxID=1855338 RepID=UPI0011603A90|nr:hypothetical protein [Nitrosospira sp. Nsp11]
MDGIVDHFWHAQLSPIISIYPTTTALKFPPPAPLYALSRLGLMCHSVQNNSGLCSTIGIIAYSEQKGKYHEHDFCLARDCA